MLLRPSLLMTTPRRAVASVALGTPVNQGHNENAAVTSLAVTTLADIPAGTSIEVFHYANSTTNTVLSIVDSAGSTYGVVFSNAVGAPLAEMHVGIAAALIPAGSTITVNFNGTSNRHGVTLWSCAGINTSPADVSTNIFKSTGTASGTLTFPTLAQTNELLITLYCSGVAPGTFTWDTGFTGLGGASATAFALPAYKKVSNGTGGTATTSWVNSALAAVVGIALKASS